MEVQNPSKNDSVFITDDKGKRCLEFKPKDDMTPLESIRLTQLFVSKLALNPLDIHWFLEKHSLLRHFEAIDETECN